MLPHNGHKGDGNVFASFGRWWVEVEVEGVEGVQGTADRIERDRESVV